MEHNFKNNKGFTSVELGMAIVVIIIFTIIMTSISYNVYLSQTEAKKTANAINLAVDIFEHIGALDYEEVTASNDIFDIESFKNFDYQFVGSERGLQIVRGDIGTYHIELSIEDYNGNNVIKIVSLTITYPVSRNNTEKIEMQRIKVKD